MRNLQARMVMAPPAVAPERNQYMGLSGREGVFGAEIRLSPNTGRSIEA